MAHDVTKSELAGGVMRCGHFGATVAWLRLAVLTINEPTTLKRLALLPELLAAPPKRLRFLIFSTLATTKAPSHSSGQPKQTTFWNRSRAHGSR